MDNTNFENENLLKQAQIALEFEEWDRAFEYFEKALNVEPENSHIYIGMLCAQLHIKLEEDLIKTTIPFTNNVYYKKAVKFATEDYLNILNMYADKNIENIEKKELEKRKIYIKIFSAITLVVVIIIVSLICNTISTNRKIEENSKYAEELHDKMYGLSFWSYHLSGQEKRIKFYDDGTVYYSDNRKGAFNYRSFEIEVQLDGDIYLILPGNSYKNIPEVEIYVSVSGSKIELSGYLSGTPQF